ncbi:hypothetical protein B0H10DRAFT_2193321 [Mycena sp. CBHHK59/15]|nr:hypothetical protein B0H10DRAFT_2193321 [Mycena sp. CBHHK59/15]
MTKKHGYVLARIGNFAKGVIEKLSPRKKRKFDGKENPLPSVFFLNRIISWDYKMLELDFLSVSLCYQGWWRLLDAYLMSVFEGVGTLGLTAGRAKRSDWEREEEEGYTYEIGNDENLEENYLPTLNLISPVDLSWKESETRTGLPIGSGRCNSADQSSPPPYYVYVALKWELK